MIANRDIEPGHTVRGWVFVETLRPVWKAKQKHVLM